MAIQPGLFKLKFKRIVCLAFLVFYMLQSACVQKHDVNLLTPEEQQWLDAHNGKIRLGAEYIYDLYDSDNEGLYNGVAADYIKLIEKKLNCRFQVVRIDNWFEENNKIISRDVDVMNSLAGTTRFADYMLFTPPYFEFPAYLIVRSDTHVADLPNWLKGKTILCPENDDLKNYLTSSFNYVKIAWAADPIQGLSLVSQNKADAVILSMVMATFYIKKAGITNLHIDSPTGYMFKSSIASRNDWPILNRILVKGLAMIDASEKEEIQRRWGLKTYFWNTARFGYIAFSSLLIVFFVVSAVLLWNYTLRKKVRLQTLAIRNELDERKRAEQDAQRQQEQLFQADKMISLGMLVSGMAHEINNPNNSIALNSELLKDSWKGILPILNAYFQVNPDLSINGLPFIELREAIPQMVDSLRTNSQRIQNIVDNLKDFSRQDREGDKAPLDINRTVADGIQLLQEFIAKHTRCFRVEYGANLPLINGNKQKIEQVVINLIQNACFALTDQGRGIHVETHYDADMGQIRLMVCDEGSGIAEKDMNLILEPFFTTRRAKGGVGLGLFITKKIINDHQGELRFASEPGQGTKVTVLFPVMAQNQHSGELRHDRQ